MGLMNHFVHIDLSSRTYEIQPVARELFEEFIGGKGVGLKVLIDMGLINQDPLAPENPLIFVTGPFTGSTVQTSARSALVTKSPLTNTFLDSHVGGFFGPKIKRAGLDYIIISGKSSEPLTLHIQPRKVHFENARPLWGKGIFETENSLKKKYPDAEVACIGPAGENFVKFACIGTHLYRQFGRGGAGAVMGSKNLKAVVIEGNGTIPVHNRERFLELNKSLTRDIMNHPNRAKRFDLGTNMWIRLGQEDGHFLPTFNFRDVHFDGYETLTSENMKKKLKWKSVGCFNCGIKCSKMASWNRMEVEGPEYETSAYLGSGCGIADPRDVAFANYICDDLGMDTISAGVVASFAMEAREKGLLEDLDDSLKGLQFGNAGAQIQLLKHIAFRKGIGDILAEGTRIASGQIGGGSEYFAIQTAGMELSGVNIKGCASMGLTLATSDFASHTRFWSASAEMNGELTFENTPAYVKAGQDEVNARNSMIVCDFLPYGFDRLAPLYENLTGIKTSEAGLIAAGEKMSNLTRLYSIRNGRSRADDTLPQRFFKEKHQGGIFNGRHMTEEIFARWLEMYYRERGWSDQGIPTRATLSRLGISRLL